jgi:peptidoglycan/LPS O-acetylase OafA/YrhL
MKKSRFIELDILRAIAANLVVIGHLRALLFVDFRSAETEDFELVHKGFYFISSLGHEAVIVFFVLSGFLVGGSIINTQNFGWRHYLLSRIVRLSIPLIPALLLTVAVDAYIYKSLPDLIQGKYYNAFSSGPSTNYSNSVSTFFGNVFFLQTILVPPFGSNSPLWSLAYEFWYYILFPLFFVGFSKLSHKNWNLFHGGILIVAAIVLSCILPNDIIYSFPIWIFGAVVPYFSNRLRCKPSPLIAIGLMACCLLYIHLFDFIGNDILLGLATSAAIFMLIRYEDVQSEHKKIRSLLRRITLYLSDSSYTLYITHFPIMLLLFSICKNTGQHPSLSSGIGTFAVYIIVIHLFTLLFYYCFERNTMSLRRRFKNLN